MRMRRGYLPRLAVVVASIREVASGAQGWHDSVTRRYVKWIMNNTKKFLNWFRRVPVEGLTTPRDV